MSEIIVVDVRTTVCQSNCKFVRRANKEMVGDRLRNVLLVLITVVCCLVAGVLEKRIQKNLSSVSWPVVFNDYLHIGNGVQAFLEIPFLFLKEGILVNAHDVSVWYFDNH